MLHLPDPNQAPEIIRMQTPPIENYGIIGNMRTAALVSLEGAIEFMSFRQCDSPTVFAALLAV